MSKFLISLILLGLLIQQNQGEQFQEKDDNLELSLGGQNYKIYSPEIYVEQQMGVILMGRSDTSIDYYSQFSKGLISHFSLYNRSMWVGVVKSIKQIDTVSQEIKGHGASEIIFLGHSMEKGGIELQNYIESNPNNGKLLVLISAFLQRNKRPYVKECLSHVNIKPKHSIQHPFGILTDGVHDCFGPNIVDFPIPSLTIGLQLDGITRITRIAQSFYTQRNDTYNNPVLIIRGGNHASLLNKSTKKSKKLRKNDLESEATQEQVFSEIFSMIRNYYGLRFGLVSLLNLDEYQKSQRNSIDFLNPLLSAFVDQESSWWFTGGDEEHGSSNWAGEAQIHMCSPLPNNGGWNWKSAKNQFHMLTDQDKIPPYYRDKHRPELYIDESAKTIDSVTVGQLRYREVPIFEAFYGLNGNMIIQEEKMNILNHFQDNGEDYVSALEISTQLASRQLLFNLTQNDAPDSLDDGSRCQKINEKAIEWAFNNTDPITLDRYLRKGVKMVLNEDQKPKIPAGPFWIWKYLNYFYNQNTNNMQVTSYYAFFSTSANPYGAGNHYCKLLSPARAIEWIYIDSLRQYK